MDTRKKALIAALRAFIAQRPGLDPCNYGDASGYRSESRSITQDRRHAETILANIEWRDSLTADNIIDASKHAFSGRLTIKEPEPGKFRLNYCTGQYFPTEYRKAAAAVLASALWDYWRTDGNSPSDRGRETFGRTIANRYFR